MNMFMNSHKAGELAYYDSFDGLIPVKVVEVYDTMTGIMKNVEQHIKCVVTAKRGDFRKGEILDGRRYNVVPRDSIHVKCGKYIIRDNYTWK